MSAPNGRKKRTHSERSRTLADNKGVSGREPEYAPVNVASMPSHRQPRSSRHPQPPPSRPIRTALPPQSQTALPPPARPADRYGADVLAADPHRTGAYAHRKTAAPLPADSGLVVEEVETGWVGAVVRLEKSGGMEVVVLEDRHGKTRSFPLGPGFWVDGKPVILTRPKPARGSARPDIRHTEGGRRLTVSGSIAVEGQSARVARASRIWVEGRHDAELVEKVWGDDLRVEGVVVELLEGVDNLAAVLRDFQPGPQRRAGVLVDHLVAGSKETRLVQQALAELGPAARHVKVLGHPYVDVWQAVKPTRVGLKAWPQVPRGTDIKVGTLRALGWPCSDQSEIAQGWKRILGTVRDYRDLEPALLGRMEELIDFVTVAPQ